MTYLVSAYSKDDTLYPKDIRIRALIDQRLHFDLGTLSQRMIDYYVSINGREDLIGNNYLYYKFFFSIQQLN